jgi:UDP-N-acetylmuramyl pentapeptide phosphotransferase/UDP-N-acetylglucosamine-1-phosphate transferase
MSLHASLHILINYRIFRIDAYLHTKPNPKRLIKGLQSRTFVFIIVTFAVQITHDIITSLPQLPAESRQGFQGFYFCYMFVVGTTTSVGLLVAGYRVQKQLKLFKDVDRSRKRLLKRVSQH